MKLITEYRENDIEFFVEAKDNGPKRYAIEGIFAQAESQNRNGRIYPMRVMESAVNKYVTDQVRNKRSVGELNHPDSPTVNLDRVSHLITDLRFEKNDVVGKAYILETPMGQIVKGLVDGGVKLGVSTRGMGSLMREGTRTIVADDYVLNTVDIVQDPSAQGAFVNGILEGVNFTQTETGAWTKEEARASRKRIAEAGRTYSADTQIREFKNFLDLVSRVV